jgi:hypothetical protein
MGVTPPPNPFLQQASGQILKNDVNVFSSTLDLLLGNMSQRPNPKSLTGDKVDSGVGLLVVNVLESTLEYRDQ